MRTEILTLSLLGALPAGAAEIKAGDLTINDFRVRARPGGAKVGVGYLTYATRARLPTVFYGSRVQRRCA